MTQDDLDRRHARATWLIRRHAALAAAKAFTIGRERLSALTAQLAELYQLTPEERRRLAPLAGGDASDTVEAVAAPVRAATGVEQAIGLVRRAKQARRLLRAGRALSTGGIGAAARVARGGALVGRAAPVVTAAWGAYAVGRGAWFLHRARAYQQAARELAQARVQRG